jgi:nitrogen fixation protein FixH
MTARDAGAGTFTGRHMLVLMVVFFGVVIAVNLTLAVLASRTWSGLEVANSYVASQNYNEEIAAARRQDGLGWTSGLAVGGDGLVLSLSDGAGRPVAGAEVSADLRRPVHEREDTRTRFVWTHGGEYRADTPAPGAWRVEIEARAPGGRRYRQLFRITVGG